MEGAKTDAAPRRPPSRRVEHVAAHQYEIEATVERAAPSMNDLDASLLQVLASERLDDCFVVPNPRDITCSFTHLFYILTDGV